MNYPHGLLIDNSILNKYSIDQLIGHGKFGNIFKGHVIKTNEMVAIKVEKKEYSTLKHETIVLNYLYEKSVKQIPKIYWYGIHCNLNCLIMPYYNCSLFDFLLFLNNDELIKIIMTQMIHILKNIHGLNVIHRDIKPHNFMINLYNSNTIKLILIDFGMAEFCIDDKQTEFCKKTHIIGTPKYISIFVHDGEMSCRRDDLISLGYICIWMLDKKLPWESSEYCNIENDSISNEINQLLKNEKCKFLLKINEMIKTENNDSILYVTYKYLSYCHNLNITSIPHYDQLIKIFEKI